MRRPTIVRTTYVGPTDTSGAFVRLSYDGRRVKGRNDLTVGGPFDHQPRHRRAIAEHFGVPDSAVEFLRQTPRGFVFEVQE